MKNTIVALAACALLAAGCGGGHESANASSGGDEATRLATAAVLTPLAAPVAATLDGPSGVFKSGQPASSVWGQPNFHASLSTVSRAGMSSPLGVAVGEDGRVFVADAANNRVLVHGAGQGRAPLSALLVLGQPDFDQAGHRPTARDTLAFPMAVSVAGGKLAIADHGNNRVLVYHALPNGPGALPDLVVGKQDFTSQIGGCENGLMQQPRGVVITPGGKLVVADTGNDRVLVWNTVPTSSGELPDLVLGQPHPNACPPPAPFSPSAFTPHGVWADDERIVVVDATHNRALVWNTFPQANNAPADVVIGQADFTRTAPNDDDQDGTGDPAPTARTLFAPFAVTSDGARLAIADTLNNRVLLWQAFPTQSFQPADLVFGHAGFTQSGAADFDGDGVPEGASPLNMHQPRGLALDHGNLYVVDGAHNRVTRFAPR